MNRYSRSGFPSIFKVLLALLFVSLITDALGIIGGLAIFAVMGSIVLCVIAIFVFLIVSIFGGGKNKAKVNLTNDLLKALNKANFVGNKIVIDEETYLLITTNDVSLNSIDIYMNKEYIGNLAEFAQAYPNAYNNLCNKLIKAAKKNKKKKKDAEDIIEPIKQVVVEKDCNYYIKKFHELSAQIEAKQIQESINETIKYLEDINKVEQEFGDSKNKTRKLYEYYLPMYADILANYDRLYDNAPSSIEFKENEVKLTKTSNLINTALKSVCDSLTESYYTDLNVDMKTLESILKKDGLVQEKMETK